MKQSVMLLTGLLLLTAANTPAEPLKTETRASILTEIQDLRQNIQHHNDLYYRKQEPEISDAAFDKLCRRLEFLESNYPEVAQFTGAKMAAFGDDRTELESSTGHESRMLSLLKCYSVEEAIERYGIWKQKLDVNELTVRLEPKVDGVAINAIYREGKLDKVLSRGDGSEGQDLTRPVLETGCLPRRLRSSVPVPTLVELRGEAYIPRNVFRDINRSREREGAEPFAHERTLAAGTLRHSDLSMINQRGLKIVIFTTGNWLPAETIPKTETAIMALVESWGAPTLNHFKTVSSVAGLKCALGDMESARHRWAYPTDGLVMEVETYGYRATLGTGASAPSWAAAYKFPSPSVATVLRAIVWQEGKTGKRTPVARFDPVVIGGRTIRRASLYTEQHVLENNFAVGDTILVELRGDVIPVISKQD